MKISEECPVLGVTGTGGAGKSSLMDEVMLRIRRITRCQSGTASY